MERLSYYHQPSVLPHQYISIPRALDVTANRLPEREAYIFRNQHSRQVFTYRALAEKSRMLAGGLLKVGLRPGDRVAVFGDSSPEWLLLDYATLRIKVILIKIDSLLLALDDFGGYLEQHKTKVLFIGPEHYNVVEKKIPQIGNLLEGKELDIAGYDGSLQMAVLLSKSEDVNGALSLEYLMTIGTDKDTAAVQDIQDSIDPDEGATVFATSGSTGRPKLCLLSHFFFTHAFTRSQDFGKKEVCFFNSRPFTWLGSGIYLPVTRLMKLCHANYYLKTDPKIAYDIMAEEGAAVMLLSVSSATNDIKEISQCKTLRSVYLGGECIPRPVINKLVELGKAVTVVYGSTEIGYASLTITSAVPDECPVLLRLDAGGEVKVLDSNKCLVPGGTPGTIWLRSHRAMNCYLDNTEETDKKMTNEGWVNMDDIGILHPSGEIQVIGRSCDVIMKGEVRVFPMAVELMLQEHPKVQSAIVVGVPDDNFGEDVAACVAPKAGVELTTEELLEHSKEHGYYEYHYGIATYPTYFLIIPDIPQLPNGKPDKITITKLLCNKK